jgi:Heterokaryon incompatibility protein (HET)
VQGRQQSPYNPLNNSSREFRLLVLRPGPRTAHIRCRLRKSSLADIRLPAFVALSYTWTNSLYRLEPLWEENHLIEVNGYEFSVSRNLILALSELRDRSQPKTFWIDAICIDQKNIEEKNHQVSLMKEIYGRAYSVIAWLGPEDNDSSRLLEFAAAITDQQNPETRQRMTLQELERRTRFNETYQAFFERSYWYRTWIIQEIFSAKRLYIQCGPVVINWKSLEVLHKLLIDEFHGAKLPSGQVLESMDDLHPWILGGAITRHQLESCISSGERFLDLSRVRNSSSKSLEGEKRRQLHRLLFENWDAVATDPLDKVFALLGLASDLDEYDIVVDYDLTVNEVFTTVVENYIRIYGNLSIILPGLFRAQHIISQVGVQTGAPLLPSEEVGTMPTLSKWRNIAGLTVLRAAALKR